MFFQKIGRFVQGSRDELPFLQEKGVPLYKSLLEKGDGEERSRELGLAGEKILKEGENWGRVKWRQFALMHNAAILSDTPFEGGDIGDSIEAWHTIFSLWHEGKGYFTRPKLSKVQIERILDILTSLKEFHELRPWNTSLPVTTETLETLAKEFVRRIREEIGAHGKTYIPIGYRGGVVSDGHVFIGKIEEEGEFVTVHFFNQGAGSSLHPPLSFTTSQERASYRFYPIRIEKKLIFGEVGEALFCHLFRFASDRPHPQLHEYRAREIYAFFLHIGELIPDLGQEPEKFAVNPQKQGNCPEKGPKNVIRDNLLEEGFSLADLEEVFFNAKLCSQVMGYHTYLENPKEIYRGLVYNGAEEVGFLAQKLKGRLSKEEMASIVALLSSLIAKSCTKQLEDRNEVSQKTSPVKRVSGSLARAVDLPTKIQLEGEPLVQLEGFPLLESEVAALKETQVTTFVNPEFRVETILMDLPNWIERLTNLPELLKFGYFYECMLALPIPNPIEESIWTELTAEEGKELISHLKRFYNLGIEACQERGKYYSFLACSISLAITDQIARQNPETKLEKYLPFFPVDFLEEHFFFLPNGRENVRLGQVMKYFRKQREQRREIFPSFREIPFEEAFENLRRKGIEDQVTGHIHYLAQFTEEKVTDPFNQVFNLWTGRGLPEEIQALYYFSSRIGISSTSDSKDVYFSPSTDNLVFKSRLASDGKQILTRKSYEKSSLTLQQDASRLLGLSGRIICIRSLLTGKGKDFTTNDAVCVMGGYGKLPEKIYRDLIRITRKENLKVSQAHQWLSQHYFYLHDEAVREVVAHCFLAPGLLYTQLMEEPTFILPLRRMIKNGIEFLGARKKNERFFLLSLGVSIELIYREVFPGVCDEQELTYYLELLKTETSELLFELVHASWQLQMVIFSEREEINKEELRRFFKHFFKCEEGWPRPNSLFYRQVLGTLFGKFGKRVDSPEVIRALCEDRSPQGTQEEVKRGEWNGTFPEYKQESLRLNVISKTLFHKEKGWYDPSGWETCLPITRKIREEAGLTNTGRWATDQEKRSDDGTLRVYRTEQGDLWERELELGGEKRWYRVHTDRHPIVASSIMAQCGEECSFYVPIEKRPDDPEVVVFNLECDIPLYQVDCEGESYSLRSLGGDGIPYGVEQVRLPQNGERREEELHPLLVIALKFAPPKEIECYIDPESKQIQYLRFFSNSDWAFKVGPSGLENELQKGYCLTEKITLPQIYGLEGGLILQNEEGDTKLILLERDLIVRENEFSREVIPNREKKTQGKVYVYSVDPLTGKLLNLGDEENLYLSYLCKINRDYEGAFFYLKKVGKISSRPLIALSRFSKIKDSSPQSLAFNLHLFFRYMEAFGSLAEEQFREPKQKPPNDWMNWGIQVYISYLRSISREDLSAIPRTLRLSRGEEKILLSNLQRYEKSLPQQLTIRYELLTRLGGQMEIDISPKEIHPIDDAFEKWSETQFNYKGWKIPREIGPELLKTEEGQQAVQAYAPYPVRMSEFDFRLHFHTLYEQARNALSKEMTPFDLTLYAITKSFIDHISSFYGQLLLIVRYFPEDFPPLDSKATRIPEEILEIAERVAKSPEYRERLPSPKSETLSFPYEKKIHLSYPPEPPPEPFGNRVNGKKQALSPLRSCMQGVFKNETLPLQFTLPDIELPEDQKRLEREIVANYLDGIEEAPSVQTVYTFCGENLESAQKALEKRKNELHASLTGERKDLIKLLNSTSIATPKKLKENSLDHELSFRFDGQTRQTIPLLPETILKEVILKNDTSFLRKQRPLLSEKEREEIIRRVHEYTFDLMVYEMAKKASLLLQSIQETPDKSELYDELATLLDYEFNQEYDPYEYPEIAHFYLKSGKLPRPEQMKIYFWICEGIEKGENRLFQMMAGGGKTSYLTPLVMLRVKRKGYLPIFCSTQSIYPIDKVNLHATLQKLEEWLALLEVGMHVKLTVSDLRLIFDHLRIYREEGRELIITPQIPYALHLLYLYAAFQERDVEKVKYLSLCRAFFKKRGFLILDESHRNLNALTRAIFGVGGVEYLPTRELKLFLNLMKPLLGVVELRCKDGATVAKKGRLQENVLGVASPQDLSQVRKALASYMCSKLSIPEENKHEFFTYWTRKKASQPPLLREWAKNNKVKADEVALVSYFLLSLLPKIVKMRTELDHAPSIYPEEEFDTPCHHKTASTAQFEDPYRALALSIKGTFHRGLNDCQVRTLVWDMIEKDREEQSQMPADIETPSHETFRIWMEELQVEGMGLRDLSFSSEGWVEVDEKLRHYPPAIERYLLSDILPQIARPSELLTSTPVHLLHGFAQSVSFSATPSLPYCYPDAIDAFSYERGFEAQVVAKYSESQNQQKLFPEKNDPKEFFPWLFSEDPSLAHKVEALIDPGGFFCDSPNRVVAEQWLRQKSVDGVLFFEEGDGLSVDRKEVISLLIKGGKKSSVRRQRLLEKEWLPWDGGEQPEYEVIRLEGNDWESVLKERGVAIKGLRIGTYYDAAHTESADIPQKSTAKALLFAGDTLTSSHLIQSIMRLRGFLDPKRNQTITWVIQADLAKKIDPRGEIGGKEIFHWSIKNELSEMRKQVVLAAFQQISFYIQELIEDELDKELANPERQIEILEKYRAGFCQMTPHNPYEKFAEHETHRPTDEVLRTYAEQEYARYRFDTPLSSQPDLLDQIETIARETSKRLKTISTNFSLKISQDVELQTQVQRDVEKEQYRPRPKDPRSAAQIFGDYGITKPDYPEHSLNRKNSREVFETEYLTENLYFEKNQLRTANEGSIELWTKYLKPIDFFLIICHNGKYWAEVVCNEILSAYFDKLAKGDENEEIQHSAFILSSEGELVLRAKGSLTPPEETVQEVLESVWLKDLIIDAALLKGEVRHPERLQERIANWPDFLTFWDRIVDALPNKEAANTSIIHRLVKQVQSKNGGDS